MIFAFVVTSSICKRVSCFVFHKGEAYPRNGKRRPRPPAKPVHKRPEYVPGHMSRRVSTTRLWRALVWNSSIPRSPRTLGRFIMAGLACLDGESRNNCSMAPDRDMPGNELAALHQLFDFRLIRNSSRTVYSSVSTRDLLVHKILPKDTDCLGIASKGLAKLRKMQQLPSFA